MNLIERAKGMVLAPAQTWPVVAAEPATPAQIYKDWLLVLAAIPAVCSFVGLSLIGLGAFGLRDSLPVGLVGMVLRYLVTLLTVFVMALVVDALAPGFGGTRDRVAALKLIAYGSTASFVAGVFALLPLLGSLVMLAAAVYSLYVIYLGLPVLMKCPQDKAPGYLAVIVLAGIVVGVLLSALMAPFMAHVAMRGGDAAFTIRTPDGEVRVDADAAQRMAGRLDAARKSGDPASAGKALGDMMGALAGGSGTAIAATTLKSYLPETLGGLRRESSESSGSQAIGIASSVAKASYVDGERRARVTISDLGGLGGLASVATWAGMTMDKETDEGTEKVWKDGARTVHEEYRKDGSRGEVTVILANGVIVETAGEHVDAATLKSLAAAIDLGALEALRRPAKT
jgi:hypothetical protein